MDQHLQFLDPEARARTVKYMREQIGGVFGNTPYGIGLAWGRSGDKSVSSIYFWRKFSQSRQPDYVIDLPAVEDDQTAAARTD
jgi:hypothetical protein